MLMEWSDLEPGDEIEITKEAFKEWYTWAYKFYGVMLKVVEVNI